MHSQVIAVPGAGSYRTKTSNIRKCHAFLKTPWAKAISSIHTGTPANWQVSKLHMTQREQTLTCRVSVACMLAGRDVASTSSSILNRHRRFNHSS